MRVGDQVIELFFEVEVISDLGVPSQRLWDGVMDHLHRQVRGGEPDAFLLIGIHHVVLSGLSGAAGLPEGHAGPCERLEFDRDVLEDMTHPGAVILPESPHKTTGFAVGAAVLMQRRQPIEQLVRKPRDSRAWVVFEGTEIQGHPDHFEPGVLIRTSIDAAFDDLHNRLQSGSEDAGCYPSGGDA